MKESQITTKLLAALNQKPKAVYWKIVAHPHQPAGLPDIIGLENGRFTGIEVKVHRGKGKLPLKKMVSLIQRHILQKIRDCGGVAQVAVYIEGDRGFYLLPLKKAVNYPSVYSFVQANKDHLMPFPPRGK